MIEAMAPSSSSGATASQASGGRMWQNGKFSQRYDRVGPCLGSGGMGTVWAARLGENANATTSSTGSSSAITRGTSDWVAVKAIPLQLGPSNGANGSRRCAEAGLREGLRECLSTFGDLNPLHVVRWESYWLEDLEQLSPEIRAACGSRPPPPIQPPPGNAIVGRAPASSSSKISVPVEVIDSGSNDVSDTESHLSLRFCEGGHGDNAGDFSEIGGSCTPSPCSGALYPMSPAASSAIPGACLSLTASQDGWGNRSRLSSGVAFSSFSFDPASRLSREDSSPFLWEDETTPGFESSSPTFAMARPEGTSFASVPAANGQARRAGPHEPSGGGAVARPDGVGVLLIEMELMGRPPDQLCDQPIEERLTLRAWLQKTGRKLADAADVFGYLILGVRHIHRKRIVHADLKPDNIFCVMERSGRVTAVRIGDFGLAGENQLFRQFSNGVLKKPSKLGGTPGYVAPEAWRCSGCPCSDKVDIFACAVIMLELLLPPFGTQMERVQALELFRGDKFLPESLRGKLPKTQTLLREMGGEDPSTRLSAEEACKRFEKEVRKELCRSSLKLCGDTPADPRPVANGQAQASPGSNGTHKKNGRKGKSRS